MKELILWLGLLTCPAMVFAVYGTEGLGAFDSTTPEAAPGDRLLAFDRACAACHGRTGAGTGLGPSLIAAKFGPTEMADDLIRNVLLGGAATRSTAHRGQPVLANLAPREIDAILRYLREMQRAGGIR